MKKAYLLWLLPAILLLFLAIGFTNSKPTSLPSLKPTPATPASPSPAAYEIVEGELVVSSTPVKEGLLKYQETTFNKTVIKGRIKAVYLKDRLVEIETDDDFFQIYVKPETKYTLSQATPSEIITKTLEGDQLEELRRWDIVYAVCQVENCLATNEINILRGYQ